MKNLESQISYGSNETKLPKQGSHKLATITYAK